MIVTAWNPPTDELEKTYLSQYAATGAATLKVKNSSRFVADKMIMVGSMGYEQTEMLKTDAPSDSTTIVLDAGGPVVTKYPHNTDDPVYLLRYDQVLFYRAATVGGVKTLIATLPVDVSNDEEQTIYEDLAGTGTSYYWTKYKNSITGEETEFSDFISAAGADDESLQSAVERANRRLKDPGYSLITPQMYLDFANEVNDDLTPQTERPYNFLHRTVYKNRVAGQAYIDFEEDFEKFDYLIPTNTVSGVSSSKPMLPIPYRQFRTGYASTMQSDMLSKFTLDPGGKKILIKPIPRTNLTDAYEIGYWAKFNKFKNLSDLIQTPTGTIYYYKFLAEGYSIKAERDPSFAGLAQKYEQKYSNHVVMLQRMNRKDVGTPRSFMDSQRTSSYNYMPRRRYTL